MTNCGGPGSLNVVAVVLPTDPSVLAGSLLGHTDAVWGLAYSGIKNRLLSCSADGTVRLWNPKEKTSCLSTYNVEKGEISSGLFCPIGCSVLM